MAREIKTDHYVRTADGTVYRVRYVHERDQVADLAEVGEITTALTLPLAELRRVPDPRNKRPAIEGIPDERPTCAFCGKPIAPIVGNHYDNHPQLFKRIIVRRTFEGWRTIASAFHSNGCAVKFAAAAHRAGYRIVKGGK